MILYTYYSYYTSDLRRRRRTHTSFAARIYATCQCIYIYIIQHTYTNRYSVTQYVYNTINVYYVYMRTRVLPNAIRTIYCVYTQPVK